MIHQIGVIGGDVAARIADAKNDPTFLLAEVEIVATFALANINRHKLEALLHKFFDGARLDLELKDCFWSRGKPIIREKSAQPGRHGAKFTKNSAREVRSEMAHFARFLCGFQQIGRTLARYKAFKASLLAVWHRLLKVKARNSSFVGG